MTARSGWRWLWIGLMVAGLGWGAAGCSGDDDEEDAAGTVVTNVVNGTTVVVTNNPPGNNNPPANNPADDNQLPAADPDRLTAPDLIAPGDGALYEIDGPLADVNFQWTAVPGATGYRWEASRAGMTEGVDVAGTSTSQQLPLGDYTWAVQAKNAEGEGPFSASYSLTIRPRGASVGR